MNVLTLAMILFSILFLYFVIRNINRNKISFELAFMWIVIALFLTIIAIFDRIPDQIATLFGFSLTSNFLLSSAVFFLLVLSFLFSLQLSNQKEQIKTLVQELSMIKKRTEILEQQKEKKHD